MAAQSVSNNYSESNWISFFLKKKYFFHLKRYRLMDPIIVFNTAEDGCSLHQFYQRCTEDTAPVSLLLLKTSAGRVLGSFNSRPFDVDSGGHYYGSGESFVFRFHPHAKHYVWRPGQEELFMLATRANIAVGGNAIYLDDELWKGRSEPCETFKNECLVGADAHEAQKYDFECVNVEVWAFQHADEFY